MNLVKYKSYLSNYIIRHDFIHYLKQNLYRAGLAAVNIKRKLYRQKPAADFPARG